MKNLKIGTKMLLVILAVSLVSLFVIATLSYTEMLNLTQYSMDANTRLGLSASEKSKTALKNQAEEYITKIANEQALKSDAILSKIQSEMVSMSAYMTSLYENSGNFEGRMLKLPNEVPDGAANSKYMLPPGVVLTKELEEELYLVSNAEYMLAPILENNTTLNNIYLGTKTGISYRYSRSNAYDPDYDPRTRGWYLAAKADPGRPCWVDTYIDSYGSVCVTACMSFEDADGRFQGVIATDITLKSIQDDIISMKIGETGYAFLTDNVGEIIAHPRYGEEGFETKPALYGTAAEKAAMEELVNGEKGLISTVFDGKDAYLAYAALPTTNWKLGIVVDQAEIIAPAVEAEEQIRTYTDEALGYIHETLRGVLMKFVIILSISAMVILVFSFILSKTITGPVKNLMKQVELIGNGNLDTRIEVSGRDEIAQLSMAFNKMAGDLKEYIGNLSLVTAEKERIGAELQVATQIQASMLPCLFPAFPSRKEFDIYASMMPAKEVGGDFYDFFLVDEEHLAVVVADVSGKGVPAALFMVIAKTLIKNHAQLGQCPAEVFTRSNEQLCEGNEAGMFVTAFMGVLNLITGEFTYVNAGHNPPCLRMAEGNFEFLKLKSGFVLAGMEGVRYQENTISLKKGDMLYLYTDGVTEATDSRGELFSDFRLLEALNTCKDDSLSGLLAGVKADIDAFVKEAPQFDDITMLVLSFRGQ